MERALAMISRVVCFGALAAMIRITGTAEIMVVVMMAVVGALRIRVVMAGIDRRLIELRDMPIVSRPRVQAECLARDPRR